MSSVVIPTSEISVSKIFEVLNLTPPYSLHRLSNLTLETTGTTGTTTSVSSTNISFGFLGNKTRNLPTYGFSITNYNLYANNAASSTTATYSVTSGISPFTYTNVGINTAAPSGFTYSVGSSGVSLSYNGGLTAFTRVITVRVTDSRGVYKDTSFTVNGDTRALTIADPGTLNVYGSGSRTLTVALSTTAAGSGSVEYTILAQPDLNTGANSSLNTASISGTTLTLARNNATTGSGTTTINIRATDSRGITSDTGSKTITIDTRVLTIADPGTLTLHGNGSSSINVALSTTAAGSGSVSYTILTQPALNTGANGSLNTASISGTTLTLARNNATTGSGTTTINIRATDSRGVTSDTGSKTITIDTRALTWTAIETQALGITNNQTIAKALAISLSAGGSGGTYTWTTPTTPANVSSVSFTSATGTATTNTFNFTANANVNHSSSFTLRVQDSRGITTDISFTFNADTRYLAIADPGTMTLYGNGSRTLTVALSTTAAGSGGVTYSIIAQPALNTGANGSLNSASISGTTLTLARNNATTGSGTTTINIRATDSRGITSDTGSKTITIDTRALTIVDPGTINVWGSGSRTLTVTLSTTAAGSEGVTYSIIAQPALNTGANGSLNTASISGTTLTLARDNATSDSGTTTINIRATDSRGITSDTGSKTINVDTRSFGWSKSTHSVGNLYANGVVYDNRFNTSAYPQIGGVNNNVNNYTYTSYLSEYDYNNNGRIRVYIGGNVNSSLNSTITATDYRGLTATLTITGTIDTRGQPSITTPGNQTIYMAFGGQGAVGVGLSASGGSGGYVYGIGTYPSDTVSVSVSGSTLTIVVPDNRVGSRTMTVTVRDSRNLATTTSGSFTITYDTRAAGWSPSSINLGDIYNTTGGSVRFYTSSITGLTNVSASGFPAYTGISDINTLYSGYADFYYSEGLNYGGFTFYITGTEYRGTIFSCPVYVNSLYSVAPTFYTYYTNWW